MSAEAIADRVRKVLRSLPEGVLLVAAAKTRAPDEVRAALEGGLMAIGHNYVQEAEAMRTALSRQAPCRAAWHLIGHLQRNKAKRAVALFDMIETLDSARLARALDRHCAESGKVMPVLVEINSGEESTKTGVRPEEAEALVRQISELPNLRIQGLMTMGPAAGAPENARPYFRRTRELFDRLAGLRLANVEMHHLSMGMSNSYKVALEEGANIVRVGTMLFGPRQY